MNSPVPVPQLAVGLPKTGAPVAGVPASQHAPASTAEHNDVSAEARKLDQNPLWVMAIALGIFCGIAAIVIGFG